MAILKRRKKNKGSNNKGGSGKGGKKPRSGGSEKVSPDNNVRVQSTQVAAEEISESVLKSLGQAAGVISPAEMEEAIDKAISDRRITQNELATILKGLARLIAVTQQHSIEEAGFLAGKAKEARVLGDELVEELAKAGLVSTDDMLMDIGRGSLFFKSGRRLDVGSLMAALALSKSSVMIPKRPGSTAIKDRLFSEVPEARVFLFGDEETCYTTRNFDLSLNEGDEDEQTVTFYGVYCNELYDPEKHTHVIGTRMADLNSTPVIDVVPFRLPQEATGAKMYVGEQGAGQCEVILEIAKLWPSLKAGERIPLAWNSFDADLENGEFGGLIEAVTRFVSPGLLGGQAPRLVRIAPLTNSLDTKSIAALAAMIGITHWSDMPIAQAIGLFQGSLEGVVGMSGTVDYNTAARVEPAVGS